MLSIKNLELGYGKVKVLHGINIDVPKGQVITLIGSNGAGKTTTTRAITGMIKPTAGEVTLGGEKIDGYDSHKIARLVLAHSPEGRRVFTTMSVTDNLLLGAFPCFTGSRQKAASRMTWRSLSKRSLASKSVVINWLERYLVVSSKCWLWLAR